MGMLSGSGKVLLLTQISPFPLLSVGAVGSAMAEQNGQGKVWAEDPLFELPLLQQSRWEGFPGYPLFCQFTFWGISPVQLLLFDTAIVFDGLSTQHVYRGALMCWIVLWAKPDVFSACGRVPRVQSKHIRAQDCPLSPCLWFLRIIFCGWGISLGQERGHPKKFHS